MRIAYDHQIFSAQKYGGISRYFVEVANHIAETSTAEVKVLSPVYFNAYLTSKSPDVKVAGLKMPMIKFSHNIYGAVNQALAGPLLHWFKPDLVHETYYVSMPVKPRKYKVVVTVYDMIHELFPTDFPADDSTRKDKASAIARADHVICISEHTRRDLVNLLGVPHEKTSVIHLGFSLRTGGGRVDIPVRRPFLLYVGTRSGYKNFACLLQAYATSGTLKKTLDLVAFGGGAITAKEAELVRQLGIPPENLRQIQGGDDVLAGLYRCATALVYPSLYEGFGIPPLEAMSFDCPVVCSNTSSMPEVVGDAALLFDPLSAEALGQALVAVLEDAGLRQALITKGRERIKNFSWDKCAQETMTVYKQVLSGIH